jgi:hypothetical protein
MAGLRSGLFSNPAMLLLDDLDALAPLVKLKVDLKTLQGVLRHEDFGTTRSCMRSRT